MKEIDETFLREHAVAGPLSWSQAQACGLDFDGVRPFDESGESTCTLILKVYAKAGHIRVFVRTEAGLRGFLAFRSEKGQRSPFNDVKTIPLGSPVRIIAKRTRTGTVRVTEIAELKKPSETDG